MPVALSVEQLETRIGTVQKLLKPLVGGKHAVPCCFVANPSVPGRILSGHPGGSGHTDHRALWFPTFIKTVQCQYFEIWLPSDGEKRWELERAYLSISRVIRQLGKREDILCVHCDPLTKDSDPLASYRKGPHLHVMLAQAPLPRAHFPLNACHLQQVLASVESLTNAMQSAIGIVCHEVICHL